MINRNPFNEHTLHLCFLSGMHSFCLVYKIKILLRINALARDESFMVRTQGY